MKANKALKRLAKIDSLMTDVAERFKGSPQIREALQDAKSALARAKAAVGSQASSEKAKTSKADSMKTPEPVKRKLSPAVKPAIQKRVPGSMAKKKATAKATPSKKKAPPARKKAAAKPMAAKTPAAITARKRATKKTAHASVEIPVAVETAPSTVETTPADVEVQTEPAAMSVDE